MKNWRTTAIGVGGAVALTAGQLLQGGVTDWKVYLQALILAALGVFAKDSQVTGGTIQQ